MKLAILGTVWAISAAIAAEHGKRCPGSPNQCSLHGSCMINRHGEYVCNCQWGYTGNDCSKKLCPHGFDPLTSNNAQEKKFKFAIIRTSPSAEPPKGSLMIQFHGHVVEMENVSQLTSEACAKVFRRFRNLGELSCRELDVKTTPNALHVFEITLHSFPTYPIMNNIYYHSGNPSNNDFSCNIPSGNVFSCEFSTSNDSNFKEYLPCSNHGTCNYQNGLCACESGYHGAHCGSNQDAGNMLESLSEGPYFSGNLLHLAALRSASSSFHLMNVDVAGAPVFTMDGEGTTRLHRGSLTVPGLIANQIDLHSGHFNAHLADVTLTDSRLTLRHSLPLEEPLVQFDVTSPTCSSDLLRLSLAGQAVFQIDSNGETSMDAADIRGNTVVGGSLAVSKPSLFQSNVKVEGHLTANGGASLMSDLSVRGQATSQNDIGLIQQLAPDSKSVLDIQATTYSHDLILSCSNHQVPLFDVASSGQTTIHQGGLNIHGGGVHVEAGGATIASGGLHIHSGGLRVDAGAVEIHDNLLLTQGLNVSSTESLRNPLRGVASHPQFCGSVLSLEAVAGETTLFDFVKATDQNGTVWNVRGDGDSWFKGKLTAQAGVISSGPLVADHQAMFRPRSLKMQQHLKIPNTHSYIHITDDGVKMPATTQEIEIDGAHYGQLLIVQNDDTDWLHSLKIPPLSSALFVFDGQQWQTLTATEFDTTRLVNVKEFSAAANLNIGEYQLTAHSIQVGGQPAGRVAMYGKGGVLSSDSMFTYEPSSSTLNVHQMQVNQFVGKIDMTNSELRGVDIIGGYIRGINMSALLLEVTGEMYVESNAYVGGGLVVDGQVMGSGSYVDSSDIRFKSNITNISNALTIIKSLRGVEYSYNVDAFPTKKFTAEREIGFIAQEVDQILPQVITTDKEGYNYVAYSRVVPVVVEAMKIQANEIEELKKQIAELQDQLQEIQGYMKIIARTRE